MRYMRALNQWLENDVRDRHNEMRNIAGRVDALRNDLSRLGPYLVLKMASCLL